MFEGGYVVENWWKFEGEYRILDENAVSDCRETNPREICQDFERLVGALVLFYVEGFSI